MAATASCSRCTMTSTLCRVRHRLMATQSDAYLVTDGREKEERHA